MDMYATVLADALKQGSECRLGEVLYPVWIAETREYCLRKGYMRSFRRPGAGD